MGDVINLRSFRKSRKRVDKKKQVAQNRSQSGRSKAERTRDRQDAAATIAFLDDRRLDKNGDEEAS